MQQGRGLVLRQLPRRSGIAGQLFFDKRLGVAQRPVGLTRAGGLAPTRGAAAEVPPRRRAGTDGATLSYMGLPCPNLGTGGFNFHGPCECITAEKMDQGVEILLNLVELYK